MFVNHRDEDGEVVDTFLAEVYELEENERYKVSMGDHELPPGHSFELVLDTDDESQTGQENNANGHH